MKVLSKYVFTSAQIFSHAGIILLLILTVYSCRGNKDRTAVNPTNPKESLINLNKALLKEEDDKIKGYIARRNWKMEETGTGLRFMITKKDTTNKKSPKIGSLVSVEYSLNLLDGQLISESKKDGLMKFHIGQEEKESGLHEGLTYLNEGEKATFILPSHLAWGLSGYGNKIPPKAILVYQVHLLSVQD